MRRSGRTRKAVIHYGDVETYAESNSEDENYGNTEYLPPRILPTRSCNIKSDSGPDYNSISIGSRFSREKREILKQIDIKFKFESYADLRQLLLQLLEEITQHESAWPFLEPVPKDVPYYHTIILDPIDLSTIKSKVIDFSYSSEEDFFDDLNLMFENCKTFNEPGTDIFKAGVFLKKFVTKLKTTHFPDFEDIEAEDIIIDRVTRQKPRLDESGRAIRDNILKTEIKPEPKKEVKQIEDPRFSVSGIFPKYLVEPSLDKEALQQSPELVEVALFFWLLGSTDNFHLVGNQNFTLSAVERAFIVPHQSSLFLSLNFLLIAKITEIRSMRKIFTIAPSDIDGFSDVIDAKILGSKFHIGKLVERFYDIFTLWNKTRNILRKDLNAVLSGELDVSMSRLEQIEVELDFYNELLFSFTNNVAKEYDTFCSKVDVSVFPFSDLNSFIGLSALERVKIAKALMSWRVIGYQDLNIYNALRLLDAESLNQNYIGVDFAGNRFYYFPQFFKECRLYKQSPSLEEQFYSFQQLLTAFESPTELKKHSKQFKKIQDKKYEEDSDKVYDLRELKSKLKRRLHRRETSIYLSGLCEELTSFLRNNKGTRTQDQQEKRYSTLYTVVVDKILCPLLEQKKPVKENRNLKKQESNLPDVEISDTDDSDSNDGSAEDDGEEEASHEAPEEANNNKRKRSASDISESSAEGVQPKEESNPSEEHSSRMEDIIYDGSTYIPIRRSARTRKTVKRLEVNFGNDRPNRSSTRQKQKKVGISSRKRKLKKIKKSINRAEPGQLIKNEIGEIQSYLFAFKMDAFEAYLQKNGFEDELALYRFLKAKFALTQELPGEASGWELICKTPSEMEEFISSLQATTFRKKNSRSLLHDLENIRETAAELVLEQQMKLQREEKKHLQELELQSASRKRSSRIQQEQEKLNKIREAQEFERMKEVRKECAAALWKDYRKKRKNQLNRERRVLRIEYQKALELERQREIERERQEEELKRQMRMQQLKQQMREREEAYRRQRAEQLANFNRNRELKAAQQNAYLAAAQSSQYGYNTQTTPQQVKQLDHNAFKFQGLQQPQQQPMFAPNNQQYPAGFPMPNYQANQGLQYANLSPRMNNGLYYQNQLVQQNQMQGHQQQSQAYVNPNILQTYQNLQNYSQQPNTTPDWQNNNTMQDQDKFF